MTSLTSALLGDFVQTAINDDPDYLHIRVITLCTLPTLPTLPRPKSHVRVTQAYHPGPTKLHAGLLQCHGFHGLPILLINAFPSGHQSLTIAKRSGVLRF